MNRLLLALFLSAAASVAHAELRVFTCEPEWAALATEIGGDLVETYSATTALQDPHYIQARPSLIAKLRRADLVVCSGAQLEVGWLPQLFSKASNPRVQPGNPGFIEASALVTRLEVPTSVDRAQGDIHPLGNPHVQTNPHNVAVVAGVLAARLAQLDAGNADTYRANLANFQKRWSTAIAGWESRAAPLKGKRMITHHKSWVYLEQWLGMQEVANLEPIPGVPPTAAHLADLLANFGKGGADLIVRAPFQDPKPSEWLSERSGIRATVLPLTVGGTDKATDLFHMFDDIIDRLLGESS
jgi:zinc/manganese transport system substrate-binding protein